VTPPHVPGYPGARLPGTWEREAADIKRELVDIKGRLKNLEDNDTTTRRTLQSYSDEEEDSQVTIPTDAPPRAKVILGFASGLTPNGRLIIGLAFILALTLLLLRGVKLL
jgi:hypothetical protein